MKSLIALLVWITAGLASADTTRRLVGFVRNSSGTPIANLTLHFYQKTAKKTFTHLTAVTAANGLWFIDLPPGEWRGAANSNDILRRGYFCFPGFVWGGDDPCPAVDPAWPPLWGGGLIEWSPLCGSPSGPIVLTVEPTRPELNTEKPGTTQGGVKVTFETTGTSQDMTVVRQWRIEKTTDLLTWEPLRTVALSGTSPVIVPDPASAASPVCFYRAVQVEDIVASGP